MIYIVRKGLTGAQEIKDMMNNLRNNPPASINGQAIVIKKDYSVLKETDLKTGKTKEMDFPTTSDVLQFFLTDGCKISVRPSGTEPKIKFYIEVHDKMTDLDDYDRCNRDAVAKIARVKSHLGI